MMQSQCGWHCFSRLRGSRHVRKLSRQMIKNPQARSQDSVDLHGDIWRGRSDLRRAKDDLLPYRLSALSPYTWALALYKLVSS